MSIKVPDQTVEELKTFVVEELPDLRIVYKDEEGWYRGSFSAWVVYLFVTAVGLFARDWKSFFYERYSNGIGNLLVFPNRQEYSDWSDPRTYKIVCHEVVHMCDWKRHPIWFPLSYVALLPSILTMRAYWEFRGYTGTMLAYYRVHGEVGDPVLDFIQDTFTGSMYFFMFPFPKTIRRMLEETRIKVENGDIVGFNLRE